MGTDLSSNSATVSFEFSQRNGIIDVGSRDEYFVCVHALNAFTNQESFSCAEGNIENTDGKNIINSGSGTEKTLSTGRKGLSSISFESVFTESEVVSSESVLSKV